MMTEEFTPTREESMRFFRLRWEQRAKDEGYTSVEDYNEAVTATFKAHIAALRTKEPREN